MTDKDFLAEQFDSHRARLRAVAYRMLGSTSEADDAVQETWLRLSRTDDNDNATGIDNLGGWLTTVTARVCLNMLRSRDTRREDPLPVYVPDPIVTRDVVDPEAVAELADSVGLAMLVVLETLTPAERLAFVLHDMFAVPFDDIATMVDRTPDSARQLASRARRRVQGSPVPDPDVRKQREVVDAFFAAAHDGDFDALVAVLHPDVVLRADGGAGASALVRTAETVAARALMFASRAPFLRRALVNGAAGVVVAPDGNPIAVMGFTVTNGKIVEIDVIDDPQRLAQLDLAEITD